MKLFFFDTETTGINPSKDRIIQFGAIYGEYDPQTEQFNELERINQYINIEGEIPYWASQVHGIYKRDLEGYGYIDEYIDEFLFYMGKSDYVIGHNVEFDRNMIIAEAKRLRHNFNFDEVRWVDTMKPTTEFVNGKGGRRPKLIKLHEKLFGIGFDGAHDAMADIIATKDCFLELKKYGFFKEIFENALAWKNPKPARRFAPKIYKVVEKEMDKEELELMAFYVDQLWNFQSCYYEILNSLSLGDLYFPCDGIEKHSLDHMLLCSQKNAFTVKEALKQGTLTMDDSLKKQFFSLEEVCHRVCQLENEIKGIEDYLKPRWVYVNSQWIPDEFYVQTVYDQIDRFDNWYAKVRIWDRWGIINDDWVALSKIDYDDIHNFQNWYAMVSLWNKRWFINEQWEELCEIKYDEVGEFKGWYASVRLGEKHWEIDEKGKEFWKNSDEKSNRTWKKLWKRS